QETIARHLQISVSMASRFVVRQKEPDRARRRSDAADDTYCGAREEDHGVSRGWVGGFWRSAGLVGLTDQTFTCAARAHVITAARRTACTHVSRAMQAARRRSDFGFTSRLGRRAQAGPRQVLRRVRPRLLETRQLTSSLAWSAWFDLPT